MGNHKKFSELPPIVELAERVRTTEATVQTLAKEYGVSLPTMVNRFIYAGFSTNGETRKAEARRELKDYLHSVLRTYAEPWMEEGICGQTDPEAFFPEKGGSTAEAKRVCMGCPVRDTCLQYALQHGERFGIWGGKSERDRRKIQKQMAA